MKILRISLQNIASLAGLQTVDFTQEPLRSTGLYSISGSTGSGKSSILDAMCLALYDRCPRLEGIVRLEEVAPGERQSDPRSLLRRGAAEGLAEVAFKGVDERQWTARWTVRRSRKKVDGKLQAANVSLFEGNIPPAGEGQLADGGRKTDVLASIEKHIGLSYEQFTRAVLLAQNDFAAFLKADDRERAEILQALTGTEQFEVISKAIHARQTEERRALEKLEAQLEGATALTEEEREDLTTQQKTLTEQVATLRKGVQTQDDHLDWFRVDKERDAELQNVSQRLESQKTKLAKSEPIIQQLQYTEIAQREARTLRDTQKQATATAAQAKLNATAAEKALKECEQHAQALKVDEENAQKTVAKTEKRWEELQPKLQTARDIQAQLKPVRRNLETAETARNTAAKRFADAQKQQLQTEEKRSRLVVQQKDLTEQHRGLAAFEPFAEKLDLWLDRLDQASVAQEKLNRAQVAANASQKELAAAEAALKKITEQSKQWGESYSAAKKRFKTAEENAAKFDAEKIAAEREEVGTQLTELQGLAAHLQQIGELQQQETEVTSQIAAIEKTIRETQEALAQLTTKELPQAEGQRDGQEKALRLLKAQMSDEAARLRTELQDGEPCPVCGSTSHPFENQAATNAAAKLEEELALARDRVRDLQQKIARNESTLETESRQLQQQQKQLGNVQTRKAETSAPQLQHELASSVLRLPAEQQLSTARNAVEKLEKQQQRLNGQDRDARTTAKLLAEAREEFQRAEQTRAALEKQQTEYETAVSVAETRRDNDKKLVTETQIVSRNAALPLQELWAAIPKSEQTFLKGPDQFRKTFEQHSREWLEQNSQLQDIATQWNQLEVLLEPEQEAVTLTQAALQSAEAEHKAVEKSIAELDEKLRTLFGDETPDAAEKAALETQTAAQKDLERVRKQQSENAQQLAAARQDQSEKTKQVEAAQSQQKNASQAVEAWLKDFSQQHEQQIAIEQLDQMLSRDVAWMETHRQTIKEQQDSVKTSEGSLKTLTQQLNQHRKQRPTKKTSEEVQAERDQLAEKLTQQESERDKVNGRLLADDQQRKRNATLSLQVQEKRLSAEPWLKLNELLGSADGAKFRGIAQRQTLSILLEYANAQLENLSNRYRLERLPNCLNLIVIDLHMAEERRSVHSLSGGESFLVSLALALGLASLTSNRLRIESLFIDEGFGSLDPETLSVAMSALMHLESQGRKVGVISHVSEMTDAIPIQIKVVKGSNGSATIEVPGDG